MKLAAGLIVAAALLAMPGALAAEVRLPLHKAGLWQNEFDSNGNHYSNQQCFDDASQMKMLVLSGKHCRKHQVTHNRDGSWTTDGICEFKPGTVQESHSDISGDFNARLTTVTRMSSPSSSRVTIVSRRLGPCKPDQVGGDIVMSNGAKINMLDVMSGHAPATH